MPRQQRLPVVRFACGVTTPVCRVRFTAASCERLQLPLELAWALSVRAREMDITACMRACQRALSCAPR
jgi:hypothetical protein